jgi:ArsR family transcriptional regulator, arsenate/arsenite/antimonite-responsive transcriptional repressor / arsenate reductase (thioredoxin)
VEETVTEAPPAIVALVAHPLRWLLLRQLTHSDRAVRELTERVDQPQNLVSYHLRKLRDGGLVRARRSAADGRDSYYAIDVEQCERQLQATGVALHPALALSPTAPDLLAGSTAPATVLFLCTGNSARSQMAAALIESISGGAVEAASAGSHPKALHPEAVRVMAERGIDISANRTTHVDEVADGRFDAVVTLCDKVKEVCPDFPDRPDLVHWSMADPAPEGPTAFERTAAELETRIRYLLPLLTHAKE